MRSPVLQLYSGDGMVGHPSGNVLWEYKMDLLSSYTVLLRRGLPGSLYIAHTHKGSLTKNTSLDLRYTIQTH